MSIKNKIMSIHEQIDLFKHDLSELDDMLRYHANGKMSDIFLLEHFDKLLNRYSINSLLLVRFLDFLQLINDESILKDFKLRDVKRLYSKLSTLFKDDVQLNIEKFYFTFNVDDKETMAINSLLKFKNRVDKKFNTAIKVTGEG